MLSRLLFTFIFLFSLGSAIAQVQIVQPAESTVTNLSTQGVVAKGWAGFDAELWMNGQLTKKGVFRVDGVIDFLNVKASVGDVMFEVRMVNPDGSPIMSDTRFIHILGAPASVQIELSSDYIRANGSSTIQGAVRVYDLWNYPFRNNMVVTVTVDSGMIITSDLDPKTKGIQLQLKNGVALFEYQAGRYAGISTLRASVDNVQASREIRLDTPLEPFSLIGLATGTAGMYTMGGDKTRVNSEKSFPTGFNHDGRIAVYARGSIADEYLLTASYDSDRKNRSKFFREIDPEYLYSIYGDNSMLSYDVQTNQNIFIRLEKNQTYMQYGDYGTDISGNEFTMYNRTLNGLKFGHQDRNWKVTAFSARTDRKVVQVEKRGEGLSGFYFLGYTNITPGSEKIRIETRDRFHSEILLKQQDKYRFTDYDIDYEQGTVFFKQPVSAVDVVGNPVYIIVTFEAQTNGEFSYLAGGRVERSFNNSLKVGLTSVTEEQDPTNYSLLGTDVKYQLSNIATIGGEFARSNNVKGDGYAYKVESGLTPLTGLSFKGYYRKVESGFFNITQSSGRRELGTQKYGVGGTYQSTFGSRFVIDYYLQNQETGKGYSKLQSISGSVEHKYNDKFGGRLKVEDLTYSTPDSSASAQNTHSTLATASATYELGKNFGLIAEHERNLSSKQDVTRPNATSLTLAYSPMEDIVISAQEKYIEGGGNLTTVGVTSTVVEGTQVYGKYEIGSSIAGQRNVASVGLKNQIKLPYDLTASASFEHSKNLGQRISETATQDHYACSMGLEYLPSDPIKASTKIEYGDDGMSRKFNYFLAGDYRFHRDMSLLWKYRLSNDNSKEASGFRNIYSAIIGLAYRPIEINDFNVIGKFELKGDNNNYIAPFQNYSAAIISIHSYLEPIKRLELGIKTAAKFANDRSPDFSASTQTYFGLLRASYDYTEFLSFGAEYRALTQMQAEDLLSGYSLDCGYAVMRNLKVIVGYNFKGLEEKDLVDQNLWSRGAFVTLSLKFNQDDLGIH